MENHFMLTTNRQYLRRLYNYASHFLKNRLATGLVTLSLVFSGFIFPFHLMAYENDFLAPKVPQTQADEQSEETTQLKPKNPAVLRPKVPSTAQPKPPADEKAQLESFLGEMKAILAQPTKVEGYIVESKPASPDVPEESNLGGYPVLKEPVALTPEQIKTAQALLLNEKSYYWGRFAKKCLLAPQAALRFLKGDQEVSILFSTSCDLWSFVYQDKLATKDYAPAAEEVNRFLSIVFPEDFPNQTQ
ncbi:secreted protein [Beggiatoa sp. PS]|nr:secreted protein [Beggiatoa sp. PS]